MLDPPDRPVIAGLDAVEAAALSAPMVREVSMMAVSAVAPNVWATSSQASGSVPASIVALQTPTSISRLWPALAAAPVFPVRTESVPSSGPNLCVPGKEETAIVVKNLLKGTGLPAASN